MLLNKMSSMNIKSVGFKVRSDTNNKVGFGRFKKLLLYLKIEVDPEIKTLRNSSTFSSRVSVEDSKDPSTLMIRGLNLAAS